MKKISFIAMTAAVICILSAANLPANAAEEKTAASKTDVSAETVLPDDESSVIGWSKDEQGRLLYKDESGKDVTGVQIIDGEEYDFYPNGVLKTGWRTVNGKRRFYDPETGKPFYGWIEYCGQQYYISEDEGKLTGYFKEKDKNACLLDEYGAAVKGEGFTNINNKIYYFDENGSPVTGEVTIEDIPYIFSDKGEEYTEWQVLHDKAYYYDPETGKAETGFFTVDSKIYYVMPDKGRLTGITAIEDTTYVFDENGVMQTGLQYINSLPHYYNSNGTAAKGFTEIDGTYYYFNEHGEGQTGFCQIGETIRYFKEDGTMAVGLLDTEEGLYYFHKDGTIQTGFHDIEGNTYYFASDGKAVKGLVSIRGDKYLFDENGHLQRGLASYNGDNYGFADDGKMLYGIHEIDGKQYYFSVDDGKMNTGRLIVEGKKYYFGTDGSMQRGIISIDGNKYYFSVDDGTMQTGRLIVEGKKYFFGTDGTMQTGMATFSDGVYYFGPDGTMQTGWQTIDGNKYHFNTVSGKMEANKLIDDYNLAADGHAVPFSSVQKRAQDLINDIGTNTAAIFNYVCNHNKYQAMENQRSLSNIQTKGWAFFANYAFDNTYIMPYYFAAITDILFQHAGFTTRIVYGTGRGNGDHYWNQILVDKKWVNFDTCNGYYSKTDDELKAMNYTFKQYITATYY